MYKIKALGFDIGGTLVNYNKPLNWSALYENAINYMCNQNNIQLNEIKMQEAKNILTKYNTRVNPREVEVSSDQIFKEIFIKWNEDVSKINTTKRKFYDFFQREATIYVDAMNLLKFCKENFIKCAVYTDVAYGMDDEYSLKDIDEIKDYIDLKLTSINVGYRKPNKRGFEIMLNKFKCLPQEMMYIGDEEKDIKGAKAVNMKAVLINRDKTEKNFDQDYTIKDLTQIIDIIKNNNY